MGWDCRLHVASSLKNLIPGLLSEKLSTVSQSGSAFHIPTDSEACCSVPSPATAVRLAHSAWFQWFLMCDLRFSCDTWNNFVFSYAHVLSMCLFW